jgi:thiol-disulfide isomerase/thioredoxin
MDLDQWFDKGLTPDQFIASFDKHAEGFHQIYDRFGLPDDDDFFRIVKEKKLRAVVLAEVWCGHCMLNIPVLLRLADRVDMPVRFLPRDANLELMDQYLTNEKRIIPIFILIDEAGNEVATWGPKTDYTDQFVREHTQDLPAKDAADYKEVFTEKIQFITKAFCEDNAFWHATYEDLKKTLG